MIPMFAGNCECGCAKVYGAKYGDSTHSDWCPWSLNYRAPAPSYLPRCDNTGCYANAAKWVQYNSNGPVFNYCHECFQNSVFSGIGVHDYGTLDPDPPF